ncbi:LPXTG cell wall anchor domain-containing protein [Klenkia sp. LSe6-5]|uniref:LPXTG cell wall anchor domain-containing protein n=1 Tax=Klenkia sesuvii TaxID=3103137 RepID=A0ABU8DVF6_9ACTN
MRVRHLAVVGAAVVAAWAGGTGIAQAGTETEGEPTCSDLVLASVTEDGSEDDPCGYPLPDDCEFIPLFAAGEGEGDVLPEFPCGDDISLDVKGDCEDPETFTFIVNATGLNPNSRYEMLLFSDPDASDADVIFPFRADEDGDVTDFEYTDTESEGEFDFPAGAFTLYWEAGGQFEGAYPTYGVTDVAECEPVTTEPVVEVPPTTTPVTPAPVAAPVHVAPVAAPAAHPAVLANTGSPVTSAALLGGGLLLAGAGALVATRRRAS